MMASILKIIKSGGGGHGLLYPGPVTIHIAGPVYIWTIYLVYLFGLFIAGTCQSVGTAVHESPGQIMNSPGPFMKRWFVMTGPEHT